MMQGCTKAVSCLRPKKDTKYTLNIEASAQSRLHRRETSKYIYMKSERVSGMLGVETSSNSDSPPHRHRLQTRCFPGWVWGFLFYCYSGVRQGGYGVHGGNTMNCELWEPETKIIQTSRVSRKIMSEQTFVHSKIPSECWRQSHSLALLPTSSNHQCHLQLSISSQYYLPVNFSSIPKSHVSCVSIYHQGLSGGTATNQIHIKNLCKSF